VVASSVPGWLEPLGRLPISVSKRIVFYSIFFCALNVVFFHATLVPTLFLLVCAGVGGLAIWAASRATR
jgi:small-conductance mechanosensitive channel